MIAHTATIPPWNNAGLLPPVRPGMLGNSTDRSPYIVDLATVVDRFATSPQRMSILDGLLRFRAGLHSAGIVEGFQWLDGSFMEQVESLEGRPPRDLDVVTFFNLPPGQNQRSLNDQYGALFDQPQLKENYSIDAYFVELGQSTNRRQVKTISYWYSMWSHRRDGRWKGFLQVDLNPVQDREAKAVLNQSGGNHV